MKDPLPAGVLFRAPAPGRIASGDAGEALAVVLGLAERGLPVQLAPFGPSEANCFPPAIRNNLEKFKQQRVDPQRSVVCQFLPANDLSLDVYGRSRIGRLMWDTEDLPNGWAGICNMLDEVWVPNQFNRDAFAACGVKEDRLRVVPPGVDTKRFHPQGTSLPVAPKRSFNFLSILEWNQRKGPDVLLRAFLAEFKPDEDVALILKISRPLGSSVEVLPRLLDFVEREAGVPVEKAPAIILLQEPLTYDDMPRLYRAADAFVLPSRAEAYGRTYMEALASECPVIATRWSGQLEFLGDGNSYLIDCKVVPAPPDIDVETYAGKCWAEPEVEHLRQLMRHVFTHREEAKDRAVRGRCEMTSKLDWNVVIPQWVAEFERLLG
jgi:glycosyltransferase involved in cell wall biosynthesis